MSAAFDSIHPIFRECLAAFEVWRKMGYPVEEIFFAPDKRGAIAMVLRHKGIDFTYLCGRTELSQDEAVAGWRNAAEVWNGKLVSQERREIYEGSRIRSNVVGLILAMNQKGLRVGKIV